MSVPSTTLSIGVDIGGTFLRAAVVDSSGAILARCRRETPVQDSAERFATVIGDMVTQVRHQASVATDTSLPIGLAVPATLDRDRRVIVRCTNLPQLEGCPFGQKLTERIGGCSTLLTDAEAATWGEYAARTSAAPRFVHLRVGTGVACGLVVDGAPQRLDADRTTHLDVLVVEDGDGARRCSCGLRGCLETVASGSALAQRTEQLGLSGGVAGLAYAVRAGDRLAQRVVDDAAEAIGKAIVRLTGRFTPDVLCLGGGVVDELPTLAILVRLRRRTEAGAGPSVSQASLEAATLGDDAGLVGAALLGARTEFAKSPGA